MQLGSVKDKEFKAGNNEKQDFESILNDMGCYQCFKE